MSQDQRGDEVVDDVGIYTDADNWASGRSG